MRDRNSRYRAVRDVATSQVMGYRRSGLNQAANVTAVLIKRCRTVLAERCAGDDRERRIRRTQEELEEGQRQPCSWPGCKHRERTGR